MRLIQRSSRNFQTADICRPAAVNVETRGTVSVMQTLIRDAALELLLLEICAPYALLVIF